jgi:bacterioferritin-associated ferredoxin
MYLCICNALNESRVRAAVHENGASTLGQVYRCCGVRPGCGRCGEAIRDFVRGCKTDEGAALRIAAE